jgi:hypothetical protein
MENLGPPNDRAMRVASLTAVLTIAGCSGATEHAPLHARPAVAAPIAAPAPPDAPADALVATTCAQIPVPVAGSSPIELDLNGDHVPDHLVPIECDGKMSCVMDVFLTAQPCPVALGRLGDASGASAAANGRRPEASRALWPLTSHGITLIHTEEDLHRAENTSVWAWDGTNWLYIFSDYRWWGKDSGRMTDIEPAAESACLDAGTPTAAFDIDGDGVRDGVYAVACENPDERDPTCGNWVMLAKSDCRVPVGVLANGAVTLVQSATADLPAVLKVTGGALGRGSMEYRFEVQRDHFGLAALRSCPFGRSCGPWKVADNMAPDR